MGRSFILVICILTAAPADAQRVEISASGGYSASEGVEVTDRPLLGQVYDSVGPAGGGSFNVTAGTLISEALEVEFLFGRQHSQLRAEAPDGRTLPLAELTLATYQGNIVYNFGPRDGSIRPFVFFGAGATTYSFGATLLTAAAGSGAATLDSDTRFSSALGGGAKFYFLPAVGLRVAARWTPTYIATDADGLWCDPFYGCWPLGDPQYANQFDSSAGITVRF
jgi:hypothetical protein